MKKTKYIKLYEDFSEPAELTTKEEVEKWLDRNCGVIKYAINDDLTVDVKKGVFLSDRGLTSIPVKFRWIGKRFDCSFNNLTNLDFLENLEYVGGNFSCSGNNLTNLDGLKNLKDVGMSFSCSNNFLTNLDGLKNLKDVSGNFYCNNNFLTKQYFDFDLDEYNPGYEEESKPKIAKNFIEKLIEDKYKEHRGRILDSIKVDDPEIYNIIKSNYNLENAYERQEKFGGQEEVDL